MLPQKWHIVITCSVKNFHEKCQTHLRRQAFCEHTIVCLFVSSPFLSYWIEHKERKLIIGWKYKTSNCESLARICVSLSFFKTKMTTNCFVSHRSSPNNDQFEETSDCSVRSKRRVIHCMCFQFKYCLCCISC